MRYLPNGNAVTNLSLATSEQWTDKRSGEKVERTEWHRVSLFGKVAEIAGEYLRKGSQCCIEGKLQTREWEKDGIKRYTTEIIVDINGTMQLLGSRPQVGQQPGQAPDRQPAATAPVAPAAEPAGGAARSRQLRRRLYRSPRSTTWQAQIATMSQPVPAVKYAAAMARSTGHPWGVYRGNKRLLSEVAVPIWLDEENAH